MIEVLTGVTGIAVFAFAAYGWGRASSRICYGNKRVGAAYTTALGVATWMFLGGVCNGLGVAYRTTLLVLLVLGLVVATVDTWPRFGEWGRVLRKGFGGAAASPGQGALTTILNWLPMGVILVAVGFLSLTLLPATLFNAGDDYHTYFARPLRMLATGTLQGSPFELIGVDSLGGQAFFHAYTLLAFSLSFLNQFDSLFCFGLSAVLLVETGRRIGDSSLFVLLATLGFMLISVQVINISAVYSGVLIMLSLLPATVFWFAALNGEGWREWVLRAVPIGLLFAALVVLKVTFFAVVAVFWSVVFGLSLYLCRNRRGVWAGALATVASTVVGLFPWVWTHRDVYSTAIALKVEGSPGGIVKDVSAALFSEKVGNLWSSGELFWGGTYFSYNSLLGLIAVMCAVLVYVLWKRGVEAGVFPGVLALGVAAITVYLGNAGIFLPETAIRYSSPVLLVAFLTMLLIVGTLLDRDRKAVGGGNTWLPRWRSSVFGSVLLIFLVSLFGDPLLDRIQTTLDTRSQIFYERHPRYVDFAKISGNLELRQKAFGPQLARAQEASAPGAKIFAWVSDPFLLDFGRNPVVLASYVGMANPALDIPFRKERGTLEQRLRTMGVQNIILQYRGLGTPPREILMKKWNDSTVALDREISAKSIYLRDRIKALALNQQVIYDDGGILVIRFDPV
ncbi:MAG: hypothetical protein ACE5FN_02030 [Leptospirillia bacterium]